MYSAVLKSTLTLICSPVRIVFPLTPDCAGFNLPLLSHPQDIEVIVNILPDRVMRLLIFKPAHESDHVEVGSGLTPLAVCSTNPQMTSYWFHFQNQILEYQCQASPPPASSLNPL